MADLNDGVRWQMVTCSRCKHTYQCTPEDDYYGADPDGPMPGPDEGVCFACLLALNGMNPETTPVRVVGLDGGEIDPRDLAAREPGPWPDRGAAETGP